MTMIEGERGETMTASVSPRMGGGADEDCNNRTGSKRIETSDCASVTQIFGRHKLPRGIFLHIFSTSDLFFSRHPSGELAEAENGLQ